jgi:hypothetical protein
LSYIHARDSLHDPEKKSKKKIHIYTINYKAICLQHCQNVQPLEMTKDDEEKQFLSEHYTEDLTPITRETGR